MRREEGARAREDTDSGKDFNKSQFVISRILLCENENIFLFYQTSLNTWKGGKVIWMKES